MNPLQLVNQAMTLLRKGDLRTATEIAQRLEQDFPALAPVQFLKAELALAIGQALPALSHINRAIELDPSQPGLALKKAHIEIALRQGQTARDTARKVADKHPADANIQRETAGIFTLCDDHEGAAPFLDRAATLEADNPATLFDIARNRFYRGDMDSAENAIDKFLEKAPGHGEAILLRARLKTQKQDDNHIAEIEALVGKETPWPHEVRYHYALAKEKEDIGDHAGAFAAIKAGSALQREHIRYDSEGERKNMTDIAATFTPEAFAAIPDANTAESPLFIVGLPRTGTTLVERILSAHKDVISVGETNDFTLSMGAVINRYIADHPGEGLSPMTAALRADYSAMGKGYIDNIKGMTGQSDHVIDKMPVNFLYCGLIKKALPNARIIHLVRDPMDTCFAIYKTLFNHAYYFSYDMEELADYYIAYRALMAHWHKLMPGAILDVSYEALVADPLVEGKRLMDYCGFDWSDDYAKVEKLQAASSTASAAQVRRPIYTSSVNSWQTHRDELASIEKKLSKAGYL